MTATIIKKAKKILLFIFLDLKNIELLSFLLAKKCSHLSIDLNKKYASTKSITEYIR
jgi:hypothetical protein